LSEEQKKEISPAAAVFGLLLMSVIVAIYGAMATYGVITMARIMGVL
jgi:hypothetical protein